MNKKLHTGLLIILLILGSLACNSEREDKSELDNRAETEIEFDKTKWSIKEGSDYPYRELMLNDILYNDSIRTLDNIEIIELLGEPDRINKEYLYYTIDQKRIGLWPIHTKTLVIKFSEDNIIDWMKIHE